MAYLPSNLSNTDYFRNFRGELKYNFSRKKKESILLSRSFKRIGLEKRSQNVFYCGKELDVELKEGSPLKLQHAKFCRDRLCPMCAFRRSLKVFSQVSAIMDHLGDTYRYIFLTLTVPNVKGSDLKAKIKEMQAAWVSFQRRAKVKRAVKGFIKVLEVTYNKKSKTYHPHFHIILAVDPCYFDTDKNLYMSQSDYLAIWKKCMNDDSISQVDVRALRNKHTGETSGKALYSAIAEVAKYTVKSSDYIYSDDPVKMDKVVFVLADALVDVGMISFGGCFAKARKELQQPDVDADLINIKDDEKINDHLGSLMLCFRWRGGLSGSYVLQSVMPYELYEEARQAALEDISGDFSEYSSLYNAYVFGDFM